VSGDARAIFRCVADYSLTAAVVLAAPWWLCVATLALRKRSAPSLDDVSPVPPGAAQAERVSIVLPARNEAAHIVDCVGAIRQSTWPNLELVVVDDRSEDATGDLARKAAGDDARVRVVNAPELPAGWFGKQWACQIGAQQATGSLLLFTDADTRHAPDLVTRLVAARAQRQVELMSVAGRQDMLTVWERATQPSVFALILLRYGGAHALETATHESAVIANGQCFMLSREVYDAIGQHESVREYVAEDVMIAQAVWRTGKRVSLVLGIGQLRTRMYDGLSALMKGWGKNVYAGGRHALPGGSLARALFPVLLPAFPLALLLPFAVLIVQLVSWATGSSVAPAVALWSALSSGAVIGLFGVANHMNRDPLRRAFLAPLGAAVLLAICVTAVARGRRVAWKGRDYTAR
jgi:chlorobactene glucosyltransferase